uniref:Thioesterase family protein n=1 Tax=Streptomyces sp. NBC_00148 TaxID=2903626 RepID=A0AAU1M2F2_9ACTN
MTAVPPWPTTGFDDIRSALEAERTGPDRYRARNVESGIDRTLGSQLLALTVVLAERTHPESTVQSMHAVFHRSGDAARDIEATVESVRYGRTLSTVQVSYAQEEREHCRALVMLTRAEPDFLRHSAEAPAELPGPDACEPFDCGLMPWETRVAGGDAAWSGAAGRPAAVDVWARCKDAADDPALSRALLAFALEGLVVPVGTRPYPAAELERRGGAGQAVVLSQTITFHEPFVLDDWVLMRADNSHAGRGRLHTRIQVFSAGRLVASSSGDGLLRAARPYDSGARP